jgi:hypothetical protein
VTIALHQNESKEPQIPTAPSLPLPKPIKKLAPLSVEPSPKAQ